ncbi:hypothetical protein [Halorarum halobium]|uniref:hypothetical protein n=1 Tax=Halorarum halobium TaxID=3075121 RepID=UPI0028A83016|nr:hypothetical protein [Halobaculum sp. XH14]
MRTRRSILGTLGCAVTIPTVGCTGFPVEYPDPGTKLVRLGLTNLGDSSHRFEIRVHRDGTVVHESAHDLGGDGESVSGTQGACPWMDTSGSYVVAARLEGGEWVSQSVDEGVDGSPEHVLVHVLYDGWEGERLAFLIEPGEEPDGPSAERCHLEPAPGDD